MSDSLGQLAEAVIEITGLRLRYGTFDAVHGVDLRVMRGEVFAFLGPNGRQDDHGGDPRGVSPAHGGRGQRPRTGPRARRARLAGTHRGGAAGVGTGAGLDRCRVPAAVCGLLPQSARYHRNLGVGGPGRPSRRPGLAAVGWSAAAVGRGVGADRQSRAAVPRRADHRVRPVRSARRMGHDLRTPPIGCHDLLTTHYLDEAEQLADRVAVIDAGTLVAEGTPGSLGGRDRAAVEIRFSLPPPWRPEDLPEPLHTAVAGRDGNRVLLRARSPLAVLGPLAHWAEVTGVDLADLQVRRTSLEDIYLALTASSIPGGV